MKTKVCLLLLCATLTLQTQCTSTKQSTQTTSSNYKPTLLNEQAFLLEQVSDDKTYGYTQKNPIKVGGVVEQTGPLNERRFLNALAGPNGEEISYNRRGSCCPIKTENGIMGEGRLDIYEVQWAGQTEPVVLYINMYDAAELKAPVGFTIKQ